MKMFAKWYRILGLVSILLSAYTIYSGFDTFKFKGWIDSPCEHLYVEKENCMYPIKIEGWKPPLIEVAFDTYQAGWRDSICDYHRSNTNDLNVYTPVLGLRFQRVGDTLKVNDRL